MANAIDLNNKLVYLLITGASRGIGATMAIETSKLLKSGSVIVLIARSENGLDATKAKIEEINDGIKVMTKSIDLTKPSIAELDQLISESFDASLKFDIALLIHNVGTLGDISKWSKDIDNYAEMENYFSINVFAPTILNNRLLKVIPSTTKKFIVNITSKAGITPFKSFSFYCMGKAAREMYFRTLALEESAVLVLNYSPGPVESDMTVYAQNSSVSDEVSSMFKNLRTEKTILTTEQTTKRFLQIIASGKFESGQHVDYYDEI
jgi:sepiapterin reductase